MTLRESPFNGFNINNVNERGLPEENEIDKQGQGGLKLMETNRHFEVWVFGCVHSFFCIFIGPRYTWGPIYVSESL